MSGEEFEKGKIFFLSHSTKDRETVEKIASLLGKERCWLYEWEVKPGESIFLFDRGITDSRIFTLFWSKNAALSQWVEEETNQARIRLSRDKGFRLVVVILDDTPLPDSLGHRYYIDGKKGVNFIVEVLQRIEKDLTPKEVFVGKPILKDSFQNRDGLLDKLERLALLDAYSGIIILGPDGIGKTAFAKKGIASLFSHLTPVWVDLRIASTPLRLLAAIAKPLSIAIDPEYVATEPQKVWRDKLLPEIAQSEKMYIVFDNMDTENADYIMEQSMASLISGICRDLAGLHKPENPNVIILSWMSPDFDQTTLAKFGRIELGTLDDKYMTRTLRFHLGHTASLDYNSKKLIILAKQLKGYPLAVNLAAMRVAERGIDAVIHDLSGLRKMLFALAKELLSRLSITEEERIPLILLATSEYPLNADQLEIALGKYWSKILTTLWDKQLLDPTSPGYSLHGILRDYVKETMATPHEIMDCHGKLTYIFESEWKKAPEMSATSAQYGSLAFFHSFSAGLKKATDIKRAYLKEAKDAAIELYRRGQYDTALAYLENAREMDKNPDPIYDFYYALSLNRRGRSEEALPIMKDLTERFPRISRYHHGLGTILRWLHRYKEAERAFQRAIATAKPNQKTASLCSLAVILCEMKREREALPLVEEALEIDPGKSSVVATAVRVFEECDKDSGGLGIILNALKKSPYDARLHYRAGMILKRSGAFKDAKKHLEIASSDPAFAYSCIALADVHLQMGDDKAADEVLEKFPGKKWSHPSYLSMKATILRRREKFGEAEEYLKKAIKLEPEDPVHHGGLAQLKYEQAQQAIFKGQKQRVYIYIEEAKASLSKGLELDRYNEVLLSIQHDINGLEYTLGRK